MTKSRITPTAASVISSISDSKKSIQSEDSRGSASRMTGVITKILNYQSVNQDNGRCAAIANVFKGTPLTQAGKRKQMAKIMFLIMVPIFALASITINDLTTIYQDNLIKKDIRQVIVFAMEASLVIHNLQRERDMTALYMASGSSETRMIMSDRYPDTDRAVVDLSLWPDKKIATIGADNAQNFLSKLHFQLSIAKHRRDINRESSDIYYEVRYYTNLIGVFVNWIYESIQRCKDGALWRTMLAYQFLLVSKEDLGLERTLGGIFFTSGRFLSHSDYLMYLDKYFVSKGNFKAATLYSSFISLAFEQSVNDYGKGKFLNDTDLMRVELLQNNNSMGSSLERSTFWFDNITIYMDILFSIQSKLALNIQKQLDDSVRQDTENVSIGIFLFCLTVVVCPIIIISIQAIMSDVQKYAFTLANQTKSLNEERKRTDVLLYQMLPRQVAEQLKRKKDTPAESFDQSTIYFSDIVGFTNLAASCTPMQVVSLLNMLYVCFDARIEKYDVYKVETIGDAYMVVSGVPQRNGNRHPFEVCTMALDLLHHVQHMEVPHTGDKLVLRAGIHSGPCVAGVVGSKMPRYCLFGDTVNTSSRMESFSLGNGIQISETTRYLISSESIYRTMRRGEITVKGKGCMVTYWLLHKDGLEDTFSCMPHCAAALEKRNLDQILPQDNVTH